MTTSTFTYTRAHSSLFVADNVRTLLARIIQHAQLNPTKLMDDWAVVGRAIRTWLESGHLTCITIEFFKPGGDLVERRWDFDITYDGSGVSDDMWADTEHLRRTLEKAGPPPPGCVYRIVLSHSPGADTIQGMSSTDYKTINGLASRAAGTAVATHDITTGLRYWRQ